MMTDRASAPGRASGAQSLTFQDLRTLAAEYLTQDFDLDDLANFGLEVLRRHAAAALSSPSVADSWQPIETAPSGQVLLYRPKMPPLERVAVRRVIDWCGPTCCPSGEPTHWMPLPSAPSPSAAAESKL